jgi:Holliday junction resolvasome RuvABC endonuclease subunit
LKPLDVVGLDLSYTGTGVARGPQTRIVRTKKFDGMPRLEWMREAILLECEGADVVAVEGYAYGARHSQAHKLGELGGVVRLALFEAGIPYVDIPPTCLKKYATGAGNAKKDAVLANAIRRLGYEGSSHDEADALWLRAMAMEHYGNPIVALPATHKEGLAKVEWPSLVRA